MRRRETLSLVDDLATEDGVDDVRLVDPGGIHLADVLVEDDEVGLLAHLDGAEDVLEAHLACAPDGVALERLFEGDNLVGVADLGGIIGVAGIGRALGEGALDAGERAVVGGDGVVGARSHEHAGVTTRPAWR